MKNFDPSTHPLITAAKQYAIDCHRGTNHHYGNHPYEYHLKAVFAFGLKYIDLVPSLMQPDVLAACWTHDVIEDCRQSYNDVQRATNTTVADLTFALTQDKGKSRHERCNDRYYKGIRDEPYADFVKACDRLANLWYSSQHRSGFLDLYRHEHAYFREYLYRPLLEPMFREMDEFLKMAPSTGKQ